MQCYSGFVKQLDHGNFTNVSSRYSSPQVIFIHDFDPSNLWRSWIGRIPIPTSTCKSFNQVTNSPTNVFKLRIFNVFGLFVVDYKSTLWWKLTLNHASILAYYIVSPPFVDRFLPSIYWVETYTVLECIALLIWSACEGLFNWLFSGPRGRSGVVKKAYPPRYDDINSPKMPSARGSRETLVRRRHGDRWKQSAFVTSISTPPAETPAGVLCWM